MFMLTIIIIFFLFSLFLFLFELSWEIIDCQISLGSALFVDILGYLTSVHFSLKLFIAYQDIMEMDYVQSGEILYIPGTMTPTEVRVDF